MEKFTQIEMGKMLTDTDHLIKHGEIIFNKKPHPFTHDGGMLYSYEQLEDIFLDPYMTITEQQQVYSDYIELVLKTLSIIDIKSKFLDECRFFISIPPVLSRNDINFSYLSLVFLNEDPKVQISIKIFLLDTLKNFIS